MKFFALIRDTLEFSIAAFKRCFLLFTLTPRGKHLDNNLRPISSTFLPIHNSLDTFLFDVVKIVYFTIINFNVFGPQNYMLL